MIIWQPNQKINNGRFIIQGKPLGSGGFGITYKALKPSTGKLYAIKTLNQQMQLRSDFAEQQIKFINEALTIKGFDHPHILKVHEVKSLLYETLRVKRSYAAGFTLQFKIQNDALYETLRVSGAFALAIRGLANAALTKFKIKYPTDKSGGLN